MIAAVLVIVVALIAAAALRLDGPLVTYDRAGDVLYVVRPGAPIQTSRPGPTDGFVILNYDGARRVVGVQLLGASEMPRHFWAAHPDRPAIPEDLLEALDRWIGAVRLKPPARDGERVTDRP